MPEPTGSRIHFLIPTYEPYGGIVKVMDYVLHARALGYAATVWCREPLKRDVRLFENAAFAPLLDDPDTAFALLDGPIPSVGPDDLIFVSLPREFPDAFRSLRRGWSPERLIHIIQNLRHVNAAWGGGLATRTLTRPAARISINVVVAKVIEPWLDPRGLHRVINIGHDTDYFALERAGGWEGRPLQVAFTTWKSSVGDLVEHDLADDPRFAFRAIRETANWEELRELYQWADVFLNTPLAEEGMYLPGLEAMAAGAVVVTSDAGGNMAYCRPEENCLLADYGDPSSYAKALERLTVMPLGEVERLRAGGYAVTHEFDLDHERAGFTSFLDELWPRIREFEAR